MAMHLPLMIVFSHLRWNFVFQRPQQLLSRLAGRWRVLFVEEPVHEPGPAWLEEQWPERHVTVLVPHTPLLRPGFHDEQLPLLQGLLDAWLRRLGEPVALAWLYTPMALPLVGTVRAACVVYDCIGDLSAFKGAPRQLQQRESALLQRASLVLTGGPSLCEARRPQHPQVICLPSAVDTAHYAPDRLQPDSAHAHQARRLQDGLPRPRLGYFGVIDERLDLALLAELADAHPDWALVMVGPVVELDAAELPRRANLHWLGKQPYARLPYLLDGWDLCLMPFALNEATRSISPAKTLEYLAGGKPVVSTPLHDVVWMYSDTVTVAERGPDFVAACEALLAESPAERSRRELAALAMVSSSSWERSAQAVHELLLQALDGARATRPDGTPAARAAL